MSRSVWFSSLCSGSDTDLEIDWGGVGALVGRRGNPVPKRAPEFGDGGGGPEYPDTLSGLGDNERVPVRPGGRVKDDVGGASSF